MFRKMFPFLFKLEGHCHRGKTIHLECGACGDVIKKFVLTQVAFQWPKELNVKVLKPGEALPEPAMPVEAEAQS